MSALLIALIFGVPFATIFLTRREEPFAPPPLPPDNGEQPPPETTFSFQTCPVLTLGDQGQVVAAVQQALTALGFEPGPIDGVFGPRTRVEVTDFQAINGLKVDGIVGPETYEALDIRLLAAFGGRFSCQNIETIT